MKKVVLISLVLMLTSCKHSTDHSTKDSNRTKNNTTEATRDTPKGKADETAGQSNDNAMKTSKDSLEKLTLERAEKLVKLPLDCVQEQYPNKLDHVIEGVSDVVEPKKLHPAFYGCFDWHSSVHSHWSLVRLLKQFPDLKESDEIKKKLLTNISARHIAQEVSYFKKESHQSSERTYGWAWVLKLAEEIHTWDDPVARKLEKNLQPLTDLMIKNFTGFLPKLTQPIRVGEHQNTAFALVFAYDYAEKTDNKDLKNLVKFWAKDYYLHDKKCPIGYEPGGFDFLSPCLEEIDIMMRILPKDDFKEWLDDFMPQILKKDFDLPIGKVSSRKDGKLVHLDGLNFSRAWVLYDLSRKLDGRPHLNTLGDKLFTHSFHHIIENDNYMGSHWLGTFALYALERRAVENQ